MKFKLDEDLPSYECYTDNYDYIGLIMYNPYTEDCEFSADTAYSYSRNELFQVADKVAQLRRIRGRKGMD